MSSADGSTRPQHAVAVDQDGEQAAQTSPDAGRRLAAAYLRPTTNGAITQSTLLAGRAAKVELLDLVTALSEQTQAAIDGDSDRAQAMLAVQAHTLDTIFNKLTQMAMGAKHLQVLECYFKLALRAQAQCRTTWEAVASISNPPSPTFVKQANIAQGHQQVVNTEISVNDTSGKLSSKPPNELMERTNGQRLDTREKAETIACDPSMAAVGRIDGPTDG